MKYIGYLKGYSVLFLLIFFSLSSFANVRLPKMVSDNMVLQRDIKLPIWGWADPGETITITFQQNTYTAKPGKDGKWMATLPATKAGGPYDMTIAGKNTITVKNILVGDVWLASGQSNMEWPLSATVNNFEQEIKDANYPQIRVLDVKNAISLTPKEHFASDGWKICNPENAGSFSAVGYFFARDIHKRYNVPVGVITTEWGGTPAEAWASSSALKALPDYKEAIENMEQNGAAIQAEMDAYETQLNAWKNKVTGGDRGFADAQKWYETALDAHAWPTMSLPGLWENTGLPDYDGIVWFRKEVMIPKSAAGKELTLNLGMIDDADSTWFNGVNVGATNGYNLKRSYQVPGKLVKEGKNVITVRVVDTGGGGGLHGDVTALNLTVKDQVIPLAGNWHYQTALDISQMPKKPKVQFNQNSPAVLYNAMIEPLVPYAIKGAIWYQGESNAGRAYQYRTLFPAMIKDWRSQWKQGDFPFLFVQLANFMKVTEQPAESEWAELREAQSMTLSLPNTGMAVIIDVGEANDIHPRNKQDVGKRLALAAQKVAYGENTVYSGPTFKSMKVEGNTIRITFDNVGSGLLAKGGELKEFTIAGPDKKFVWADAKIDGNSVVVSSSRIQSPVAVRYAWANNPQGANLYNQEGLPASPFRTDTWPGVTISKK